METKATQRFKDAARKFHASGKKGLPSLAADRAQFFVDSEPTLSRLFAIEQATNLMCAAESRKAASPNPEEEEQLRFLGDDFTTLFNSPRHLLPLKGGLRRQMHSMTVTQLRQSAVAIRARVSKRASLQATYLESLADRMSPFAQTHRRLTLGDYLELTAAGIKAPDRTGAK